VRVNYLLEDTALFGGVKIALHQARLLSARGHEIRVVTPAQRPSWFDLGVELVQVGKLEPGTLPAADVNVATFWTTIVVAASAPCGQATHYCQGFEASYTHNREEHPRILEAYRTPIPGLALSPHLAELLRTRFERPARVVPPALEPWWRPRRRLGPHRPARVVVVHPFENDWKGVPTALEAVRRLRDGGVAVRLIRISQWPLGDTERALLEPEEFHCHIDQPQVARLLAGSDLLLAPSWEQEGFGLPVLEAMACGVPVIASEVSAFRGYAAGAAVLVDPHEPSAFAEAARQVLRDRGAWRRMRRDGLAVASRFTEEATADSAEAALEWIAGGRWREQG